MRGRALVVIFLLVAPLAGAEPVADDPDGDHEVTIGPAPATGARWNALDMVGLDVVEDVQGFEFTLAVDELAPPGEDLLLVDGIDWFVHFTYRDQTYRINLYRVGNQPFTAGYIYGATLDSLDEGTQRWSLVEFFEASADPAAGTISMFLPRELVVGRDGTGTIKDGVLSDVHVTSSLFVEELASQRDAPEGTVRGYDRMPDEGAVEWVIREGIDQSGSAALTSEAPVRVSNGEATTMVFTVMATNRADEHHDFVLEAEGVPESWTVTFPVDSPRIDGGTSMDLPVLVTTPFSHQHGVFETMEVTMQSQQDPDAVGRIELGIRYTPTPQPAGHHDTVYIHLDESDRPYLNTLQDDPGALGTEGIPDGSCACSGESIDRFNIPLLPGLLMGLDFDLERTGTLEIPIVFGQPAQGVAVSGEIGVYPGTDGRREGFFTDPNDRAVAILPRVGPFDFQPDQAQTITLDVQGTEFGDYLPYEQDSAMILHLDVAVPAMTPMCCLVEPSARLAPGGVMALPLDEYHDDVDDYFASLSGLDLSAGTQHRYVNPGETVIFNVTAQNLGDADAAFHLRLTGPNADWARILGDQTINVAAGAGRPVAVAVAAPSGAADGEQADVTLVAQSAKDINAQTLIRVVATVDGTLDLADEAGEADRLQGILQDKESPIPWILPLLGIAVALLRRR